MSHLQSCCEACSSPCNLSRNLLRTPKSLLWLKTPKVCCRGHIQELLLSWMIPSCQDAADSPPRTLFMTCKTSEEKSGWCEVCVCVWVCACCLLGWCRSRHLGSGETWIQLENIGNIQHCKNIISTVGVPPFFFSHSVPSGKAPFSQRRAWDRPSEH